MQRVFTGTQSEDSTERERARVRGHLMAVERVQQSALQQVQDLQRGVTGGRDQVVSRRMEGQAVHRRTVN